MAVVKGSYQYRLRVVQDEPGKRYAGHFVTAALVLTVGLASYFYGVISCSLRKLMRRLS